MRPADIRSGPMLHQELLGWSKGLSSEGEFVATSMAGYLESTGRMSPSDSARVARGGLSETAQDRIFTKASYGHPLGTRREPAGPSYLEQIGAMRQWAAGRNQPLNASRAEWLDESLTGEQGQLRSNLSESSLGGGL